MKVSVLINNYNYAQFISEAIESVAKQTRLPDELIVVDDGSTDNSLEVIQEAIKDLPYAKLISTENQGQLSAVNEGFKASTGDILFFLDSDDCYKENHIERCLQLLEEKPHIDFVYTSLQYIGDKNSIRHCFDASQQRGISVISTGYMHAYIGTVMSCMAVKRKYIEHILPMPDKYLSDWKVRADNIIIWGSSISGACKYYLREATTCYRVHRNNSYFGKESETALEELEYMRMSERIINYMWNSLGYSDRRLPFEVVKEFKTIERPILENVKCYKNIYGRTSAPTRKKISKTLKLYRCWIHTLLK